MQYQQQFTKTAPNHTSLSIIDRVTRTLRDLAYNAQIGTITPAVMAQLLQQYNNAVHDGISTIMGFAITPADAEHDEGLQREIIRRSIAANHEVRERSGFTIPVGQQVAVYNYPDSMAKRRSMIQPDLYTVTANGGTDYVGGNRVATFYQLTDSTGKNVRATRRDIKPA
jgi:hypothetical protein